MSADNGIYILATRRTCTQKNGVIWNDNKEHVVYRVAYTSAIDNFDFYKNKEQYNLGAYMKEVWGTSKVYSDVIEVHKKAHELNDEREGTEYGVVVIDASDMIFYGDR